MAPDGPAHRLSCPGVAIAIVSVMTATSLSRVLRSMRLALAPPRSLVRRPSDRVETAALRGGLLLVVLLVPFLLSVGSAVTESARRDGEIAR